MCKEKRVEVDNSCSEICKKINYKFAEDIIALKYKQTELKQENETLEINLKELKKTRCTKSSVVNLKNENRSNVVNLKNKLKQQTKQNKTLSQSLEVKNKTAKSLRIQQSRLIQKIEKLKNYKKIYEI